MDMLSVKRVREHGISDERWRIKDKIIQYKGLNRLFIRDNQIITADKANLAKSQAIEISNLNKAIKLKMAELENARNGDKRSLDLILIPHKDIRLICKHQSANQIVETVKHLVFTERKRLDIIRFNRGKKEQLLVNLKMECFELEDQKKYVTSTKPKTTLECERVTGRIQDMFLLYEAAISVSKFYEIIKFLMYRDSIFYTQLLFTLQGDKLKQNRCMIQTVTLGQIAIENLEEKSTDFQRLHRAVVKSRRVRQKDFREAEKILLAIPKHIKTLIRKDEPILYPDHSSYKEYDEELYATFFELDEYLAYLKVEIKVLQYEEILPNLQRQKYIEEKLLKFRNTLTENCDRLRKDVDMKKVMLEKIRYSNFDEITSFDSRKEYLESEIKKQKVHVEECTKDRSFIAKQLAEMRVCIENIQHFCEVVHENYTVGKRSAFIRPTSTSKDNILYITRKIKCLMANPNFEKVEEEILTNDGKEHLAFSKICYQTEFVEPRTKEDYDEHFGFDLQDSSILSYFDVKEQSRQMVEYFKSLEI